MSKSDNFITLVSAEATFACLSRPKADLRPAAIIAVAMQVPAHALQDNPEQLRHQAQQLIDWFYGGRDPSWLPEHLLYEEIEEDVEEFVPVRRHDDEEYEYVEPEESYYEQ
jgi:hypothetical protein